LSELKIADVEVVCLWYTVMTKVVIFDINFI